jgi:hypothetical protein
MADTSEASEAGRALVAARWGNQVAVRSAETVIERAAELPAELRAAVHEATGPAGGEPNGDS